MNKFKFDIIIAVLSVLLFSCNNSNNVVTEDGGIQIDPELKELGELNALLLQYDDVGEKLGDCIAVKSKKKWGLINLKGDTILDFKYDRIKRIRDEEYWNVEVKNVEASKYSESYDVGIADAKGVIIVKPIKGNQSIAPYGEGLYRAIDGKVEPHLYNNKGEEIILSSEDEEGEYDYDFPLCDIERVNDHFYMVANPDKIWFRMIYNKGAEHEFKIEGYGFYDVKPSSEYCFVKNEDEIWGAINAEGDTIAPFEYLDTKMLGNDNVFVKNEEGKWGMFNGKEVSAFYDDFYKSIGDYSKGEDAGTQIILDKQGKELFRSNDLINYPFYSNGMFLGKHSLYDSKGNAVITLNDSLSVYDYLNNYVIVSKQIPLNEITTGYIHGIVNKKGELVVPVEYNIIGQATKDGPLLLLTKNISDEFVNNERIIINTTDIFNTDNGTLTKTNYYISRFSDGLALATIDEKQHFYVNEEGKTGIVNFEDVLEMKKEEAQQSEQIEKQEGRANLEENIKKQIVELINEDNGWKVLSGPSSVRGLQKVSEGMYKAEFTQETQYEYMYYEIRNIEVDENGKVLGLETKRVNIKPKANKPDGTMNVDEMIDRQLGRIRRR